MGSTEMPPEVTDSGVTLNMQTNEFKTLTGKLTRRGQRFAHTCMVQTIRMELTNTNAEVTPVSRRPVQELFKMGSTEILMNNTVSGCTRQTSNSTISIGTRTIKQRSFAQMRLLLANRRFAKFRTQTSGDAKGTGKAKHVLMTTLSRSTMASLSQDRPRWVRMAAL